ncbi:MAG: methyl-accepting chemotaxis protein [Symploca sp. SIO2B6]|nr:methyl-accepting chemotaxis protein [Symploca sp. SIO2B6]
MIAKFIKSFHKQIKLQNQILVLLVFSTIIPIAIVGYHGIYTSTNTLLKLAQKELEEDLEVKAEYIEDAIRGIDEDVVVLSKTPPIDDIIQARASGKVNEKYQSSYNDLIKKLQGNFRELIKSEPQIIQVRYLDENGQEVVRLNSDGTSTNIEAVPEAQLQNKREAFYFTETMKLAQEEVYVSPIEFNREQGKVQEPFQPVLRYATPVFDSNGNRRGIIVANLSAEAFIKPIEESDFHEGEKLMLVNSQGYYLSHPESDKEWGFELGKDETLKQDFSPEIAQRILNYDSDRDIVNEAGSKLLSGYRRVFLDPDKKKFIAIVVQIPKREIFAPLRSFKLVSVLSVIISLVLVMPLGFIRSKQVVKLIQKLVEAISTTSHNTFSTIEQQEHIASQQAASVSETTSTMDELEASCQQSSQQAQAALSAAQEALKFTEDGVQAVGGTLEDMYLLEKKVGQIAEQILHLSERANQIGGISQLVSGLASQTNMLALNSAIEAVNAGEHGKGFAVVADEIRKLAEQSQKSADKINLLVTDIQNAVNSTVMVTEEGTKTVAKGVNSAKDTKQVFANVEGAVNQVVLSNQQISLNLREQVDGIQQVVQAMENINRGTQETAAGINQTKLVTQQLNDSAIALQKMV